MKLMVNLWLVVLLDVVLHRSADGRPDSPVGHLLPRPLLLSLGEEFSLRLEGGEGGKGEKGGSAAPKLLSSSSPSSSSFSAVNRALLQLTQRLLQARVEQQEEKGKRSDEPPISLDLTFHLLREVLEMSRAERLAQQADSNRRMMDTFGK
ncbi:corticoliberin-1 [Mugil cephalus]|uniref:corticoliberin-1 n=1 Tax=Mugil cephalus TaxID=48193 RepID=UPI001FB5E25E|nr:corticoliberin-1 [Mugil cephalus]XP_047444920.1 corticoliberin-1 [Mugil cephalus]